MNPDKIPQEMKEHTAWVCWRLEDRKGKATKVPYCAASGANASSTDPSTWSAFDAALAAWQRSQKMTRPYSGIGFVLSKDDPYVGVDLDHCIDRETGEIREPFLSIIRRVDSYTEITPSGEGVRIIARGELPPSGRKKGDVEMYDAGRFLTITGKVLGAARPVAERTEQIRAVHAEIFPPADAPEAAAPRRRPRPLSEYSLTDQQILAKAFAARNGNVIHALWNGDWQGRYSSQSEADGALAFHLAFWTDGDGERADRLFRESGLMREKWDEAHYSGGKTYGQATIEGAMQHVREGYAPGVKINRINSVNAIENPKLQGLTISSSRDSDGRQGEDASCDGSERTGEGVDSVDGVDSEGESWEPIVPLGYSNLPAFPAEVFPAWLSEFVSALSVSTQTPADLAAMMCLSGLATCLAKRIVIAPKPGWSEPVNLYTVTFLAPGNRKTAVVRAVSRPIAEFEAVERERVSAEVARAQTERRILESRQKDMETRAAKAQGADYLNYLSEAKDLAEKVASTPERGDYRLFTEDCTPERLVSLLSDSEGRMAILTDEGDTFDIISGRYSDKANLGVYLKSHSGETLIVDRVGRKGERVDSPALTIGMAAQPDVLRGLLTKPTLRGRGLLGRFLYSLPQEHLGWRDIDAEAMPEEVREAYAQGIHALLSLPLCADAPKTLAFSPDARAILREYEQEVEILLRQGNAMGDMTDWGGKLLGAVVRIAALLHIAGFANPAMPLTYEVSSATAIAAIRVGYYLADHARAAFGEMGADVELDHARYIVEWVQRKGLREIVQSEMYRAMARRFKRPEDMAQPLSLLVTRNYLREVERPKVDKRAHPSRLLVFNPAIFEEGGKRS